MSSAAKCVMTSPPPRVTISAAMVISAVNALTLSPALCVIFLRPHHGPKRGPIKYVLRAIDKVRDGYGAVVRRLVRVSVLSLVATATNLALASFPETGVAQNLFWVGLLVCLILSAVIPLFGWVVLVAFALYSFRQLRHWGPS